MLEKSSQGFGLLELFIALALGSILMMGLIKIFVSVKQSVRFQIAWAGLQEQGRFIDTFFHHQINMAGVAVCQPGRWVNNQLAIHGYQGRAVPRPLQGLVDVNSDVLVLGECQKYRGKVQFVQTAYYLAKHTAALYQKVISSGLGQTKAQLLLRGVDVMHIRYGMLGVNAAAVKDWLTLRSVEMRLLLVSKQPVLHNKCGYWFDGGRHQALDRRLYREWHIYAALSERL